MKRLELFINMLNTLPEKEKIDIVRHDDKTVYVYDLDSARSAFGQMCCISIVYATHCLCFIDYDPDRDKCYLCVF